MIAIMASTEPDVPMAKMSTNVFIAFILDLMSNYWFLCFRIRNQTEPQVMNGLGDERNGHFFRFFSDLKLC